MSPETIESGSNSEVLSIGIMRFERLWEASDPNAQALISRIGQSQTYGFDLDASLILFPDLIESYAARELESEFGKDTVSADLHIKEHAGIKLVEVKTGDLITTVDTSMMLPGERQHFLKKILKKAKDPKKFLDLRLNSHAKFKESVCYFDAGVVQSFNALSQSSRGHLRGQINTAWHGFYVAWT